MQGRDYSELDVQLEEAFSLHFQMVQFHVITIIFSYEIGLAL